jgi:hypothetical protein
MVKRLLLASAFVAAAGVAMADEWNLQIASAYNSGGAPAALALLPQAVNEAQSNSVYAYIIRQAPAGQPRIDAYNQYATNITATSGLRIAMLTEMTPRGPALNARLVEFFSVPRMSAHSAIFFMDSVTTPSNSIAFYNEVIASVTNTVPNQADLTVIQQRLLSIHP